VSSLQDYKNSTISVKGLSLTYKTLISRTPNIKETLLHFGRGQKNVVVVEALKNVSFEVQNGSVLGIIGANGAGKSTLMKAVAGLLPPTQGEIQIRGKVSAMLSLGIGFNPNLSGRENVLLGGLASGLTKVEILENFDAVVEFAELQNQIDLPMRTYSSGMYSRLGFAVATTINPEILLIDEALSAGDASFKEKSYQRIQDLAKQAKTLLVVSHALGTIQELCTDVLWLNNGKVIEIGAAADVIENYKRYLQVGEISAVTEDF
jgi:ABC-type polysaccharide/polyol phosphate transport system ATPase subunit